MAKETEAVPVSVKTLVDSTYVKLRFFVWKVRPFTVRELLRVISMLTKLPFWMIRPELSLVPSGANWPSVTSTYPHGSMIPAVPDMVNVSVEVT